MPENYLPIYGETFTPEPPRPTEAAYQVLSECVQAGDAEEARETLNDMYKALGDEEREARAALFALERAGKLAAHDMSVIVVLLAVSRMLGPDLQFLRQAIVTGRFQVETVEEQVRQAGLEPVLGEWVLTMVPRLERNSE